MRVIQFRCETDPPLSQLQGLMLAQINHWSRLQRLSNDPDYGTAPFGAEQWHQHTQDPHLYWADWDAIYAHLGHDGRGIADTMIGTPSAPGPVCRTPLLGGVSLVVADVADPVAAGYVAPMSDAQLQALSAIT